MMERGGRRPADGRPVLAIGPVELQVSDVGNTLVLDRPETPVLQGQSAPFDLMVDDIQAMRDRCEHLGLNPTPIVTGRVHRSFTIVGPDGYKIEGNASHALGDPVS